MIALRDHQIIQDILPFSRCLTQPHLQCPFSHKGYIHKSQGLGPGTCWGLLFSPFGITKSQWQDWHHKVEYNKGCQ